MPAIVSAMLHVVLLGAAVRPMDGCEPIFR